MIEEILCLCWFVARSSAQELVCAVSVARGTYRTACIAMPQHSPGEHTVAELLPERYEREREREREREKWRDR
jgi:hypothetical protein